MSFYALLKKTNLKKTVGAYKNKKAALDAIKKACLKKEKGLDDFLTLISNPSPENIEFLAMRAKEITLLRFGKAVQIYVPLYLSNFCEGMCRYCGFAAKNKIKRFRLSVKDALTEAEALYKKNFRHLLLVAGTDPEINISYLKEFLDGIKNKFSSISIELSPFKKADYEKLKKAGVDSITLYQETYAEELYKNLHSSFSKGSFKRRLEVIEDAGNAGFRDLGIGYLMGLNDYLFESAALFLHAEYLRKEFWKSKISISFPRIREAYGLGKVPHPVNDKILTMIICAFRICFPDNNLVLSTRETENFRNNLIQIAVNKISAGSSTSPGGYAKKTKNLKQFEISDSRSPEKVADYLLKRGYDPVFKDWEEVKAV